MISLDERSAAQKARLLLSYRDQLVRVYLRDGAEVVVDVKALAGDAHTWTSAPTMLVGQHYPEAPRWVVVQLGSIAAIEVVPFPPTDPRHPDYVVERRVVRPSPASARSKKEATW